jgi:putative peptide zinc metalloprotease protein
MAGAEVLDQYRKRSGLRVRFRLACARLLILAMLIAGPGAAGAAFAADSGSNTSAVAVNTQNGSSVFRLAFAVRQVTGSVVDNQNAAVAYASCTACQTVAISIQILLISGSPTTFTPTNVAVAVNQNCNLCDTLALAYQFAVGVNTELRFTHEGRREIADIRRQLSALGQSGLTGPEIANQVNTLMTQLGSVLQTQLVGVREPPRRPEGEGQQNTQPSPAATATPPTTTTTPTQPQTTDTTGAPTTTTPAQSGPSSSPSTTPAPPPASTPTTTQPTSTAP